jgi:hypothetical protein
VKQHLFIFVSLIFITSSSLAGGSGGGGGGGLSAFAPSKEDLAIPIQSFSLVDEGSEVGVFSELVQIEDETCAQAVLDRQFFIKYHGNQGSSLWLKVACGEKLFDVSIAEADLGPNPSQLILAAEESYKSNGAWVQVTELL